VALGEQPGFDRAVASGSVNELKQRIADNLRRIASEGVEGDFAIPIALVFVVDKANGGDGIAQEVVQRFRLLDAESRDIIDFHFLGWTMSPDRSPRFSLDAFNGCRDALRAKGVNGFGGNADLYVLDAWLRGGVVAELDFSDAIHVDLSTAATRKVFPTLGGFLQSLIEAAEAVRATAPRDGVSFRISDRLQLASAKQSLLDFFLDTWAKAIGGAKVRDLVTRGVGPKLDLASL
jgi:hypothetical protein